MTEGKGCDQKQENQEVIVSSCSAQLDPIAIMLQLG